MALVLAALLAGWIALSAALHDGVLSHNVFDQHTRQALAWSQGRISLDEDVSWLELARFDDRYYVSFPPVPGLLELPLVRHFGADTPNNLLQVLVAFAGLLGFWRYLTAAGGHGGRALVLALGLCLGTNYLWLSLSGAVWYAGQILGCALAIWGCHLIIHRWHVAAWALGGLLLALAVGCRPFYALMFPLVWLWAADGLSWRPRLAAIAAGALPVAAALAAYNWARFGLPWEFGHSHLPVYAGEATQFSLEYFRRNLATVFLALPEWKDGRPYFALGGNAVWLVAPVLLLALLAPFGRQTWPRKLLWLATLAALWSALLAHHSNGSAQWGYRYMVDLLPLVAMVFGITLARWRYWTAALPLIVLSIAINALGAYIWYAQSQTLVGQPWAMRDGPVRQAGNPLPLYPSMSNPFSFSHAGLNSRDW